LASQDESHTTSGGMYLTLCFTYATFLLQAMNEFDLGNYELKGKLQDGKLTLEPGIPFGSR